MRRARSSAIALVAVVAAVYLWRVFGTHRVPEGQPALASMEIAALREDFNRAAGQTRIIVLLSPT